MYSRTYDGCGFQRISIWFFDSNNVLTDGLTFAFMGKRLMNITKTGTFDIPSMSFAYDYSGKRLSKTVDGVLHQYYYDGDNLVYETETDTSTSTLLHEKKFFYDENGILTFMELDGVRYFYYIDATHTVRGLFNSNGQLIVKYSYDAWGNVTNIIDNSSISLGTLNPFLFKCYYYDHESKWYYCLTRYYIPLWMRWLTIDDSSYLTSEVPAGYNLYVYCNNNPISYFDKFGHIGFLTALFVGLGIAAVVGTGLIVGGIISRNGALINIGASMISIIEIIGGIALISTGVGGSLGMALLGTGIGSVTNGLISVSNGATFFSGWAGGEIAGICSYLIPYFGSAIGAFIGSVSSDFINSGYNIGKADLKKATYSAIISFGLSLFSNCVTYSLGDALYEPSTTNKFLQYLLTYDYSLLSISNTIINVYWESKNGN